MYLKTDKIIATLWGEDASDDIVMRSSRIGLTKEYILDPTAVTGWTDGTNVRRDSTQRLNGHGDFPEKASMGARLITFSGTAIATTSHKLYEMRNEFVGMLADGSYGTLSVETENGNKKFAYVGLEGTTSWIQQTDTIASWKINLYAPDPFIYGEYRTVQTGIVKALRGGLEYPLAYPLNYNIEGVDTAQTIKNYGNARSWPLFVVHGEYHSGFTLYDNRNNVVEYSGMVAHSAPVTIDMGKGIALQNGVDKTMNVTKRDWFSIEPGETIQPEFNPITDDTFNGTGWCDILYRDTWI